MQPGLHLYARTMSLGILCRPAFFEFFETGSAPQLARNQHRWMIEVANAGAVSRAEARNRTLILSSMKRTECDSVRCELK